MIENKEELLTNLLKESEGRELEFKRNNKDPERIGKYISAISNMCAYDDMPYGYLIFGISDNKEIIGTDLDLVNDKVGNATLFFWLNSLLNPSDIFDYDDVYVDGKKILIIRIRKAKEYTTTFRKVEYGRINDSLIELNNNPFLKRGIWEHLLFSFTEDSPAIESIKEEQLEDYLDTRKYYALMNKAYPTNMDDVISRMIGERFIIRRDDGRYNITIFGGLMIARSLSDFPLLSNKKIEVVKYEDGNRSSATTKPAIFDEGYLFSFKNVVDTVANLMGVKEKVTDGLRFRIEAIPSIIIRELVSNAMVHQSLSPNTGKILIECFPNWFEIYSPGRLTVDPDRIIDMAPDPSNRHMAEILSRFDIGEGHGTGYDKIERAIEETNLPPVLIKKEDYGLRVTVYVHKDWKDYRESEKIRAIYFHVVLAYIDGRSATNESIRKRFKLEDKDKSQISRLISKTIETGKIKKSQDSTGPRNISYIPYWA